MSVWYAIPSARPAAEAQHCLDAWRGQGYKVAVMRDRLDTVEADYVTVPVAYPGYGAAVNELARWIIAVDPAAQWIVTGGDDVYPDPTKSPAAIALECSDHFVINAIKSERLFRMLETPKMASTFGVMQPTGDRWQDSAGSRQRFGENRGAPIDRVAGSPWMGREFCRRMYQGQGPLYAGYSHMFVDEELQNVAERLGVFWQRRDLVHYHRHFVRENHDRIGPIPPHLERWNTKEHWQQSKDLFESRKAAGFPGHEPL